MMDISRIDFDPQQKHCRISIELNEGARRPLFPLFFLLAFANGGDEG